MTRVIKVHRFKQDEKQTLGVKTVFDEEGNPLFASMLLERGWLNNERNVSCIPSGVYDIELEYSDRFKMSLWEIKGVPNRSECKIHSSNFWYQLNGCMSPGTQAVHLDKDGYLDVTNSRHTLMQFMEAMRPFTKAKLIITTEDCLF
jgi:hypothetical protein